MGTKEDFDRNIAELRESLRKKFSEGDEVTKEDQPNFFFDTVRNVPSSAYQFGSDVAQAVTNPVQTLDAIGNLGLGLIALAIPDAYQEERLDKPQEAAMAVGKYISDRYGGLDKAKESLRTDPVGVLADVSGILLGGGYLATKSGLLKAGDIATKAGIATDPLVIAGKGASQVGKGITRRDVLKGTGAGLASLAVPMSMVTDVTKSIPPVAKSSGALAGIGKFRGIMDNISPYLRGSKKRENIITGEVEDWSVATQPDINELYEARKFREVDRVERATELQFDKLETKKYPEIGSANAFSQGEKLAHFGSSTRNPKIQSAIDRLHKKHDLVASEFSQIDTRMMDDIFNSDLADQRVRTDKKAFESLQETRKQMGKDFTPTFDAQQSVNEIQVISRQLDNAPDKQVVESTSKKFRDYGSKTDDVTQTITTGTVDGVPVYKIEHKYSVPKNPLQIPEEIYHVELYIPNEAGLARLSKAKQKKAKGGSVDKPLYADQKYI